MIVVAAAGAVGGFVFAGLAAGFPRSYNAHGATKATTVNVVLAPKGDQSKLKPTPTVANAGQVTFVVFNQSNLAKGSQRTAS